MLNQTSTDIHQKFMQEAVRQAGIAFERDEVPVGAVVTHKGRIIAKAYNQIKMLKDPTAHAEMIAITQAAAHLKNERLTDCDMYVTVEPCAMCAGAMVLARIKRLYYGARDLKTGAAGSVFSIAGTRHLNHYLAVSAGLMEEDCAALMREFFRKKRA